MSGQEFARENSNVPNMGVEEATADHVIVKHCNDYGTACSFFYFRDGFLYRMDQGEPVPDITIQYK